jgi:hypothetical protein
MPFPADTGEGVVLTETCKDKAIFITAGDSITIRSLAVARGRVPDKNGAGIRVERKDFTIEHNRLINKENGILTTEAPESPIRISDSEFSRNGKCDSTRPHVGSGELRADAARKIGSNGSSTAR